MKLYLSSFHVGKDSTVLRDLVGANRSAGIIMNAADGFGDGRRPEFYSRYAAELLELGISSEQLDLPDYFAKPDELLERVRGLGFVWAVGGNTFILRRAMHKSGFDRILPQLLKRDDFVYGGFSAGACVASKSLRGIHLADEPELTPPEYDGEVIWEGLNLVDFYIVPHFRSEHPESQMMEAVAQYFQSNKLKHYCLHDGQAIVVNGNDVRVV